MSRFEQRLEEARQHHRSRYGVVAVAVACGALAAAVLFVHSTGTSVRIAPPDAARTGSVSVADGVAVAVRGVVYSLGSNPSVTVAAPGFRPATRRIAADERGRVISVTLQELPGRLVASAGPAGEATRWSVDGQRLATGARFEREMTPGEYRVGVDHPHYESVERQVTIGRGETVEIEFPLRAVAGEISVRSLPSGAVVTIDGAPVGTTPFQRGAAGGAHRIDVSLDGYEGVSDNVEVTREAASVKRFYRLRRPMAALVFEVSPPGGNLLVNGKKVNPARQHAVRAHTQVDVAYFSEGYAGMTRKVVVQPGQTTRVRLHLQREYGRVEIRSRPQARVFVDGAEKGVTPLTLSLPTTPQTVSFRRPGYRTVDERIQPSSRHTKIIDQTLVTKVAARLSEAPRRYTSAGGAAMVLFHPTPFTMGAPRHQKGQRANEIERQVVLKKPFYSATYEVSNAEFRKFRPGHGGSARLPVTSVRWIDAAMYCNWLSLEEGLPPFYRIEKGDLAGIDKTSSGYRLPTEAEWEWLARRAGRGAGTVFPWGDEPVLPPQAGNVADESARGSTRFHVAGYTDGHAGPAPVGSFPAESSGLHDLTGNVSEWVHDHYAIMPGGAGTGVDPLGPAAGHSHVIKGSSWRSGSLTPLRAAYRDGLHGGRDDVGFRIARYLYTDAEIAQ